MKRFAFLLPIFAGILWASSGFFVRELTDLGLDSVTIASTRAMVAALMLLPTVLVIDRSILKVRLRDLWIFALGGLVGIFLLSLCYNYALSKLSLSLAAVLINLSPLVVVVLAAVLFHEKLTMWKMLCLALAMVGCVLSTGLLEPGGLGQLHVLGLLVGFLSSGVRAVYSLISRYATEKGYHSLSMTFYGIATIGVLTIPLCDWGAVTAACAQRPVWTWTMLILQALCVSALPYFLFNASVRYMDVGTASILAAVEPVAAMFIDIFIYAEYPTLLSLTGLVFALASLALINRADKGLKA